MGTPADNELFRESKLQPRHPLILQLSQDDTLAQMRKSVDNISRGIDPINLMTRVDMSVSFNKDVFSYSIKLAISQGKPFPMVLKMIQEQHGDNPEAIVKLFGQQLTNDIIAWNE